MIPGLGPPELLVVMIVAVLLFGKRLPEVGRSLGKGIIEFKKGIRGIDDDVDTVASVPAKRNVNYTSTESYGASDQTTPSVPKFEPPTSAPIPQSEYTPQAYQD
jgi:sec-independent protein translocase protein TatA